MGSPAEFQSPNVFEGGGSNGYNHGRPHSTQTKATIPGMTALASVAALLVRLVFTFMLTTAALLYVQRLEISI